jgi:hypothetical protein
MRGNCAPAWGRRQRGAVDDRLGRGAGARRRPIGGRAAPASVKSSGVGRTVPIHAKHKRRCGAGTIASRRSGTTPRLRTGARKAPLRLTRSLELDRTGRGVRLPPARWPVGHPERWAWHRGSSAPHGTVGTAVMPSARRTSYFVEYRPARRVRGAPRWRRRLHRRQSCWSTRCWMSSARRRRATSGSSPAAARAGRARAEEPIGC